MSNTATGKVSRFYVSEHACRIRLADLPSDDKPADGYFLLPRNHYNYNALYSLALAAATNRLDLSIRIVAEEIDPRVKSPEIDYMYVDW